MPLTLRPWRERPLKREGGGDGDKRLLDALVEAWNRELSPLLASLRQGLLDSEGVTTEITFADSPYDVLPSTKFLRVDAADGVVVVNLQVAADATTKGVQYAIVKKTDAGGNSVVVTANGTEDIDGATTANLTASASSIELWPRTGGYDIA